MNLIQQANMLKGLSDEQLQSQLSNPSGGVPPFLLTVEAQRRVDSRRSVAAQPQQKTVVESLKSQLGSGAAMPQMPPSPMPMQAPASTGLGALAQQPVQQFASGGQVGSRNLMRASFNYPSWVKTLYDLESFGGKNVVNPESGTFGPYQFKKDTYNGIAKRLGLPLYEGGNPPSLENQKRAYEAGYFQDTLKALNAAEIPKQNQGTFAYISHKYGPGAVDDIYNSYLRDENQPIGNVLMKLYGNNYGKKAIKQNRLQGMSIGDEIARLAKRFGEGVPTNIDLEGGPIDFGVDQYGNPLDQFENNMLDSLNQPEEFQEPFLRAYTNESDAAKQAKEFDKILKNIELITLGQQMMNGYHSGGGVQKHEHPHTDINPIKLGDLFDSSSSYKDAISGGPVRPMQANLTPNNVSVIGMPQVQITVPQRTIPTQTVTAPRTGQDVYLDAVNKSRRAMGLEALPDLNGGTAGEAVAELDRQADQIYGTAGEIWNQPLTGRSRGARTAQATYQGLKSLLPAAGGAMLNTIALPLRGWDYVFGEYDENGNPYPKPSNFTKGGVGIIPPDNENLSPDMGDVTLPNVDIDMSPILTPDQLVAPEGGASGGVGFDISQLKKIMGEVEGLYPEDPKQVALQNSIDKYMGRVEKDREFNKWMSLATAGFNMMGGAEGEAPFFGNAVKRGTNAGMAQYMAGNEALARQEAQGIAGLGDIAKMSADRREKVLGTAASLYEKQLELSAKRIAAKAQQAMGTYLPSQFVTEAREYAKSATDMKYGPDTAATNPATRDERLKFFQLIYEQALNKMILDAPNAGYNRTQKIGDTD